MHSIKPFSLVLDKFQYGIDTVTAKHLQGYSWEYLIDGGERRPILQSPLLVQPSIDLDRCSVNGVKRPSFKLRVALVDIWATTTTSFTQMRKDRISKGEGELCYTSFYCCSGLGWIWILRNRKLPGNAEYICKILLNTVFYWIGAATDLLDVVEKRARQHR